MRVLLAGASGYIGSRLAPALRSGGFRVVPLSSLPARGCGWLDLANTESFAAEPIQSGDYVLLMAGVSAPDVCAAEPDRARCINVTGTGDYITMCLRQGARVIFFSSDTVYGERYDEFDESAACNPVGPYAAMKREVEELFLGEPGFKTVRLSYVFSREDKFARYLVDCAQRGIEAEIFDPFFRAVIHRDDVVAALTGLVRQWELFPGPVVNFAGPQVISRMEFAQMIKDTALPALRFRKIEPEAGFFMNRPRVIRMKSSVLPRLLGRPARSVCEAAQFEFGRPRNGQSD